MSTGTTAAVHGISGEAGKSPSKGVTRLLLITRHGPTDLRVGISQDIEGALDETHGICDRGVFMTSIQAGRPQPITAESITGLDRVVTVHRANVYGPHDDGRLYVWIHRPGNDQDGWDILVDPNEALAACD